MTAIDTRPTGGSTSRRRSAVRRVARPRLILELILIIGILVAYLLVVTRGQILTTFAGTGYPAASIATQPTASPPRGETIT